MFGLFRESEVSFGCLLTATNKLRPRRPTRRRPSLWRLQRTFRVSSTPLSPTSSLHYPYTSLGHRRRLSPDTTALQIGKRIASFARSLPSADACTLRKRHTAQLKPQKPVVLIPRRDAASVTAHQCPVPARAPRQILPISPISQVLPRAAISKVHHLILPQAAPWTAYPAYTRSSTPRTSEKTSLCLLKIASRLPPSLVLTATCVHLRPCPSRLTTSLTL